MVDTIEDSFCPIFSLRFKFYDGVFVSLFILALVVDTIEDSFYLISPSDLSSMTVSLCESLHLNVRG